MLMHLLLQQQKMFICLHVGVRVCVYVLSCCLCSCAYTQGDHVCVYVLPLVTALLIESGADTSWVRSYLTELVVVGSASMAAVSVMTWHVFTGSSVCQRLSLSRRHSDLPQIFIHFHLVGMSLTILWNHCICLHSIITFNQVSVLCAAFCKCIHFY